MKRAERERRKKRTQVLEGKIEHAWIATGVSSKIGTGWHVGLILDDEAGRYSLIVVGIPPVLVQELGAEPSVRLIAEGDNLDLLIAAANESFAQMAGPDGLRESAGLESVTVEARSAAGDPEKAAHLFDGYPWSEAFGGMFGGIH